MFNRLHSIYKNITGFVQLLWFFNGIFIIYIFFFSRRSWIYYVVIRWYKYPIAVRLWTSDVPTFLQIFCHNDYAFSYWKNSQWMIDAWANVWYAALRFRKHYPKLHIICIEPEESNYNLLRKNVWRYENIFCIRGWLWNKKTYLKIIDNKAEKWGVEVSESKIQTNIQWYSIEDIMTQYKIRNLDIVKIDIEWSEKEVFEKNTERIEKSKTIVIETHEIMREWSHSAVIQRMKERNNSRCWENIVFTKMM